MSGRTVMRRRLLMLVCVAACGLLLTKVSAQSGHVSTPDDRGALFDDLVAKILRRDAFSPIKNRRLELNPERDLRKLRDDVVAAKTEEDLFFALMRVSNARRDRHLSISTVPGGLVVDGIAPGSEDDVRSTEPSMLHAPVRLAVDYGTEGRYFLFVADRARQPTAARNPGLGDKVVAVNGAAFTEYVESVRPYHRYSTLVGFWDKLAASLPRRSPWFPRRLYRDALTLGLEARDGTRYDVKLPYVQYAKIEWEGVGERQYPGFELVFKTETYDFYRHTSRRVLALAWHGFGASLVADIDRLMAHAEKNGFLEHDLIWDGTRSGGGSRGAYAVQRIQPRPFKTTFGNLRLSDVTEPFIARTRERFKQRQVTDSGVNETMDGGRWLLDWLEDDVMKGLRAGQEYSNNVPFKLAHLPKWSDGIVRPAKVHFRGRLVCLLGPYGGSHLDQFAAIVIDNGLGHTIGMPAGGYSNTWEWDETLVFPSSGKPVIGFMYNIGHTIRPNGSILEGEAAAVAEPLAQTRDNYQDYYPQLLARAFAYLGVK